LFRKTETTTSYGYTRTSKELFGAPLLFCHPKATTPQALYDAVASRLSPDAGADDPTASATSWCAPTTTGGVTRAHFKL
jgi:hypothetical protein